MERIFGHAATFVNECYRIGDQSAREVAAAIACMAESNTGGLSISNRFKILMRLSDQVRSVESPKLAQLCARYLDSAETLIVSASSTVFI
jgi:hypothetical protein